MHCLFSLEHYRYLLLLNIDQLCDSSPERNCCDCNLILTLNYSSVISHLVGPLEFRVKGTSDRL